MARAPGPAAPVFVDSSAWIALVSASDGRHAEADALFRRTMVLRVPLATTNLIVAEVHRLLLFRAGVRPAAAVLGRFESSRALTIVHATREHHVAAVEWLGRYPDQRVTYTDAVSFAVMAALCCPGYLGFDGDFARAGFHPWTPPAP